MDTATYQRWWGLHARTSRGDDLNEQERDAYVRGLGELQGEEALACDLSTIRQARELVMQLDSKCEELQGRRQQLRKEIARLESALTEETRKSLGIGD